MRFGQNTSRRCFLTTVFWTPWMIGRYCTSHFRQQRYCNTTCCKSVSPLWGIRDGSQIFFHILKPKNKSITHALVPWTIAVGWLLDLWCRFLWGCHEVFLHGYSSTGDLYLEVPSKGVPVADWKMASGCHARFIPWNFKHQVLPNRLCSFLPSWPAAASWSCGLTSAIKDSPKLSIYLFYSVINYIGRIWTHA